MLKFPSLSERRSNIGSYLSHLTASPGFSPNHSNQSSPRYGLSPLTNSQQPRRFSLHVALRKTSDGQQAMQTNSEENQDSDHAICKSANIKQDETGDSHIMPRMPYIPSNNAFNLESFMRSSEGKTTNTLSMTKGISEFDASLPIEDPSRRKTKEFKSKGISIFAPKKQGNPKHPIDHKPSKESLTSILNSSFEKELEGLASPRSSEQEKSKNNTANKFSMASVEEVQVSNKAIKDESSIVQVPLGRMMRRRSCCCSECGYLSAFEKKHQNLTNPGKREEIHIIANENARKMLRLAQKKLATADSSVGEDHSTKEEKNEEGETVEKLGKSATMQTDNLFLQTEGFSNELQILGTCSSPPITTDMDCEVTDRGNKDFKRKTSDPFSLSKNRSQARRQQNSNSPKNFIVKHAKNNSLHTSTRPDVTQGSIKLPFSVLNNRKGNITGSFNSQVDSPVMMTEPQVDLISGLQHKLQKLEIKSRVRSIEEEEKKIKTEKMKTLNDSIISKKGLDLTGKSMMKIDSPPPARSALPAIKTMQGSSTPKIKLTLGKQSIQSVYKSSSGNSTPKVLSVQQSPINKATDSMNFGKDASPKPKICIITSPNLELNRRGSGTGYRLLGDTSVTTLETIDIFSGTKSKKDSIVMTLQEENDEEEVIEEGVEKEKKRIQRKKKRMPTQQPEKRSVSMGMLLKAYQGPQGKVVAQMKKSSGV